MQTTIEGGDAISQTLTISALERATGVPRSTIHFYVRQGLLPQPAKTAASRSLYSEAHVLMLGQIAQLKDAGLSLADIHRELEPSLQEANRSGEGLAAREYQRTHEAIVRVATQEFMTKGFKRSHVTAIAKKAGVTAHVFYAHFPSKRRLLVECFNTFIKWNVADRAPGLEHIPDLGERLLYNLVGDLRVQALGVDVLSVVQSEGTHKSSDLHKPVEEAYRRIVGPMVEDLAAMRRQSARKPMVPDELVAFSLFGAMDSTQMRAAWDEEYTRADLLRTHLWLYLAIWAAMSGEVDLDSRLARYEDLIQTLATRGPDAPKVPEE